MSDVQEYVAKYASSGLRVRHAQIGRNPVELIEPMMVPESHRLALHFKEPPVLDGVSTKRTIRPYGTHAFCPLRHRNGVVSGPELRDQPFQGLTDTSQRRYALFVQFPGDAIVGFDHPSHGSTIAVMLSSRPDPNSTL